MRLLRDFSWTFAGFLAAILGTFGKISESNSTNYDVLVVVSFVVGAGVVSEVRKTFKVQTA